MGHCGTDVSLRHCDVTSKTPSHGGADTAGEASITRGSSLCLPDSTQTSPSLIYPTTQARPAFEVNVTSVGITDCVTSQLGNGRKIYHSCSLCIRHERDMHHAAARLHLQHAAAFSGIASSLGCAPCMLWARGPPARAKGGAASRVLSLSPVGGPRAGNSRPYVENRDRAEKKINGQFHIAGDVNV